MYNFKYELLFLITILLNISIVHAGISDYISGITNLFGYYKRDDVGEKNSDIYGLEYTHRVPYEVSETDEKFISEAARLTGVALSELDSCQHRVVLKLKMDCHMMNDEQLAKMAVHLLNCQSYVEARKIYPCTDEMSIKDCTINMDSDTWTSYHLMSNRAKAVCYMIRQTQFRGLAEHTVNRLMDAARDQLTTLGKIAGSQEDLKKIADHTLTALNKGQQQLSEQQKDLQRAQFHGQLTMEDNIKRLVDEKKLIQERHHQLVLMTEEVRNRLVDSSKLLTEQTGESRLNHKELLDDLNRIQERSREIFERIDDASTMLIKQNEEFKEQYTSTIKNLQEVNRTVHDLVNLVGGTRLALEERLAWIMSALGGNDLAIERLYNIIWHFGFILVAMLGCAFLSARPSTRFAVATMPPLNLAIALYGEVNYLDPLSLCCALGLFILVQTIVISAIQLQKSRKALCHITHKTTVTKATSSSTQDTSTSSIYNKAKYTDDRYNIKSNVANPEDEYANETTDGFTEDFASLTPPVSRNGYYSLKSRSSSRSTTPMRLNMSLREPCHAKTRAGTPCKLSTLPGRDYCYRHQSGSSIMG